MNKVMVGRTYAVQSAASHVWCLLAPWMNTLISTLVKNCRLGSEWTYRQLCILRILASYTVRTYLGQTYTWYEHIYIYMTDEKMFLNPSLTCSSAQVCLDKFKQQQVSLLAVIKVVGAFSCSMWMIFCTQSHLTGVWTSLPFMHIQTLAGATWEGLCCIHACIVGFMKTKRTT